MPRFLVACLSVLLMNAVGCAAMSRQEMAVGHYAKDLRAPASESPSAPAAGEAERLVLMAPAGGPVAEVNPRKVIYSAGLSVVVVDVPAAVEETRKLAEGMGGYADRVTNNSVTLRVPAARFDGQGAAGQMVGIGSFASTETI